DLLSRWWWRVDVIGVERLPARGPVLVAANRAGALLPYEAFVLARSLGRAPGGGEPGTRVAHPVVDGWLLELPMAGAVAGTLGARRCAAARTRRRRPRHHLSRGSGFRREAGRTTLPPRAVRTGSLAARGRRIGRTDRAGCGDRRRGGAARVVAQRAPRPPPRA